MNYKLGLSAHANPGIVHSFLSEEQFPYGAAMYYDVGVENSLTIVFLNIHTFLGYRKDHNSYYIHRGDIHNDGFVGRLGVGFEF
jgi:hypothetical protein